MRLCFGASRAGITRASGYSRNLLARSVYEDCGIFLHRATTSSCPPWPSNGTASMQQRACLPAHLLQLRACVPTCLRACRMFAATACLPARLLQLQCVVHARCWWLGAELWCVCADISCQHTPLTSDRSHRCAHPLAAMAGRCSALGSGTRSTKMTSLRPSSWTSPALLRGCVRAHMTRWTAACIANCIY